MKKSPSGKDIHRSNPRGERAEREKSHSRQPSSDGNDVEEALRDVHRKDKHRDRERAEEKGSDGKPLDLRKSRSRKSGHRPKSGHSNTTAVENSHVPIASADSTDPSTTTSTTQQQKEPQSGSSSPHKVSSGKKKFRHSGHRSGGARGTLVSSNEDLHSPKSQQAHTDTEELATEKL
jgi:hypothetical protein